MTNFFRDADAFDNLATPGHSPPVRGRGADETVRVWVPGCATGEEVYSIAILMREHMATLTAIPRVQIFATDIDEHALAVARSGDYPAALLDSVTAQRQERFFVADGGTYVLAKEVRDLCIFSPHSVIRDPPFSRMDLVSCRNLLIYFGTDMQSQVIPDLPLCAADRRLPVPRHVGEHQPFPRVVRPAGQEVPDFPQPGRHGAGVSPAHGGAGMALHGHRFRWMQGRAASARPAPGCAQAVQSAGAGPVFAPPHVVANREGDVVYFSTRTGSYTWKPRRAFRPANC